jgi:hypothetical protein
MSFGFQKSFFEATLYVKKTNNDILIITSSPSVSSSAYIEKETTKLYVLELFSLKSTVI